MGKFKIPDGWKESSNHCSGLISGEFFVCKTFLSNNYNLEENEKFQYDDVERFLENVKGPDIGMVIDLTNTDRYYDPDVMLPPNVIYKKIAIEGHSRCPQDDKIEMFNQTCRSCPKNKLILVHCTHGFNRTGVFIVCYLIMIRKMSLNEALVEFGKWRSGGIYRDEYLEFLKNKFN
ncbi:hypothetical protein SNEBB_004986 [Seison nebaliae]|nr:hypothetical protein SNEBB_004986 [Seison nebaliae]